MSLILAALILTQSRSMFSTIVERPTGNNGYEEYLKAADLIVHPSFPLAPEGVQSLAVKRSFEERFEPVLRLIKQGNRKPVYEPRSKITSETLLPEYSAFRRICRSLPPVVDASFARGNSRTATETTLEGLTFSDNFGRSVLIANLVSFACDSILFSTIERNLPALSRSDCLNLDRGIEALLARPPKFQSSIERERQFMLGILKGVFDVDQEGELLGSMSMKNFTPAERDRIIKIATARIDELLAPIQDSKSLPESEWSKLLDRIPDELESEPSNPPRDVVAVAEQLVSNLLPSLKPVLVASLRNRTQLRLLRLHVKLKAYEWDWGRLPDDLSDFTSSSDRLDPLTGSAFVYERSEGHYRLFSRGIPETGEVELNYRRPIRTDPIPPSLAL